MELTIKNAEQLLTWALEQNPGPWGDHSRYVARGCRIVAESCGLDGDQAYVYGLLHDIGRYPGVTGIRHMYDGYRLCKERGWDKTAQICLTHGYLIQDDVNAIVGPRDLTDEEQQTVKHLLADMVYDDYDLLVQLFDALSLSTGFCLLEKRWIDVAMRYGTHPANVRRWKRTLEIKSMFEHRLGCGIYSLLPGVVENTFR